MGALKSPRCSKGHLLRGKNLYKRKNGRECRICSLMRSRKFYRKAKKAKKES